MYSKVLSVKILTEQEIRIPSVDAITKSEAARAINALGRAATKYESFLKRVIKVGLSSRSAKAIAAVLGVGALSAFIASAIKYFGKKEDKNEKEKPERGGGKKPGLLERITTPKSLLIIGIALTVLAITAYIYTRAKAKEATQLESDVLFADSSLLYEEGEPAPAKSAKAPTAEEVKKEVQETTENVFSRLWNWIKRTFEKAINFLFKKQVEGKKEMEWSASKIILVVVLAAAAITIIAFIKRHKQKNAELEEQDTSSVTQIRIVDLDKTIKEYVNNLKVSTMLKLASKRALTFLIVVSPFIILGALAALIVGVAKTAKTAGVAKADMTKKI